jgi:hypothetical protein
VVATRAIRFRQAVLVPGGPQYNPGDQATCGAAPLSPQQAHDYVSRGWAEWLDDDEETPMATPKAPTKPPADRMIRRGWSR